MFGPAILVNPVTEPGATSRHLYLPQAKWYDFCTGKVAEGGAIDTVAPLDRMPLYVRAGSIVPMGPDEEYSMQKPANPVELRIYAGADGGFTLYEDENDNYGYENGVHATISLQWDDAKRTLLVGKREGKFPGMLEARTFHVVVVGDGHETGIEPTAQADKVVEYSGRSITVAP